MDVTFPCYLFIYSLYGYSLTRSFMTIIRLLVTSLIHSFHHSYTYLECFTISYPGTSRWNHSASRSCSCSESRFFVSFLYITMAPRGLISSILIERTFSPFPDCLFHCCVLLDSTNQGKWRTQERTFNGLTSNIA